MNQSDYKKKILECSLLVNEAQKPIQILDAIKWDSDVEEFLLKTHFKEIPYYQKNYYQNRPLKYDPYKKIEEFTKIRKKIALDFGAGDPLAQMMIRNCRQYEDVVMMLLGRGTKEFYRFSKELYGSAQEFFDFSHYISQNLHTMLLLASQERMSDDLKIKYSSEHVVLELQKRLKPFFKHDKIKIKLSDGIVSDASAGANYIKIKSDRLFSMMDIHIFEIHEGQVHLGTTMNGERQEFARFLSKGPPCATITQEGLAIYMEILNRVLYPERAKRISDRMHACKMAEDGADILQVIEYFRLQNLSEKECIKHSARIFRGGMVQGGAPFTKDISYLKGFAEVHRFMKECLVNETAHYIPFLFVGKTTTADVPHLYNAYQEGIISPACYLPPQIKVLEGMAVERIFTSFFEDDKKIA